MSPADILAEERARVEEALVGVYDAFTPTDGIGFGKRVGDGTQIAVERITDVAKQETLLAKLEAIEAAEAALANGTYGTCEVCGEQIPEARLEARPYSVRCVRHA